jgi:hypothetical protein
MSKMVENIHILRETAFILKDILIEEYLLWI